MGRTRLGTWPLRRLRATARRHAILECGELPQCEHRPGDVDSQRWTFWSWPGERHGGKPRPVGRSANDGGQLARCAFTRQLVGQRPGSFSIDDAEQRFAALLWHSHQHCASGIVLTANCEPASEHAAEPCRSGSGGRAFEHVV
jgi:hypothetical protein